MIATTPATSATPSAPGTASWSAPNVAATMNVAAAARPGRSIETARPLRAGSSSQAPMTTSAGSGSCTQNTSRQPPRSVSRPPMTGPMTAPRAPDVK